MQKNHVKRAAKADTLAQMMYDVTRKRYMDGDMDIISVILEYS